MFFVTKINLTKNNAQDVSTIIEEAEFLKGLKFSIISTNNKRLEVIMEIDISPEWHGRAVAEFIADEIKKLIETICDEHLYCKVERLTIK